MIVKMQYGKEGMPVSLPDNLDVRIFRTGEMPVLKDPEGAVRYALSNPVGSGMLREEARGRRNATIAVCDITRPVPNGVILPVIIEELLRGGMRPESITILIATGLHRPNEGDEIREVTGDDPIFKKVRIVNHFARNEEDHVEMGNTPRGIPVKLDRRFVGADVKIVVGLVEPHFMAGYSGGRKVILPGLACQDTIRAFHGARLLLHAGSTNCVLEGNPLHEEQLSMIGMTGKCFAVNTLLNRDRKMSFVNFGHIIESHCQAVSFIRPYAEMPAGRDFGTIVTSGAGYPLDKTYYQTVKGMIGALDILRPGGNLFIVSECSEGLGSREFAESQKRLVTLGANRFLEEALDKPLADIDEWESVMLTKAIKKGSVYLYSPGFPDEQKPLAGVPLIDALVESIIMSAEKMKDPAVAVIPEGPYVIPFKAAGPFETSCPGTISPSRYEKIDYQEENDSLRQTLRISAGVHLD